MHGEILSSVRAELVQAPLLLCCQMNRILFVCTGNIFRSLTAEHALRRELVGSSRIQVASAGTDDFPHVVKDVVRDYLASKGFDVSSHRRRTLTSGICDESTLIVAMSDDHQRFIREKFERDVPLFTEVCGLGAEPLYDVDDVVPDFENNLIEAAAHVRWTIDRIIELTPRFATRLQQQDPSLLAWTSIKR
jgi:protein-tyrosine phosphatase